MAEIVHLVSQDPGLSFKVLRYVNSAALGLRNHIESIQHAVVLMGLERIRAWATLFAMAGLDSRPIEILNLGLLRANLCERLSRLCGKGLPEAAYTVGLLSVFDAMLSRPMHRTDGTAPTARRCQAWADASRGQLRRAARRRHTPGAQRVAEQAVRRGVAGRP